MRVKSVRATGTRLGRIGAGPMSDALGKTGAMSHEVRPRSRNPRMAGPAFTVRIHTADILMVGKALSECPKDHVLVIDGHGECNTALWGGLTTQAALAKGVAGVVIDGAIRDSAEIARSRLPVFARAIVAGAGGAEYTGELQAPVQCGGVVVNPGDWLVGDEDGVVAIPLPVAGRHSVGGKNSRSREQDRQSYSGRGRHRSDPPVRRRSGTKVERGLYSAASSRR